MTIHKDDFEKIDRYVKGEANESERAYVEALFRDGENNLYLRQRLENDWDSIIKSKDDARPNVNLDHFLDKIHHEISKNESKRRQLPMQKFVRLYSKIAAVIILPLLVAGGIFYSHILSKYQYLISQETSSEIYAPLGSRISFNLPDGTKGMLNGGSKLSYATPFSEKRNVKLEGEAWFEVKHDEKHPFKINAGKSVVKVLGTSLNVSAYTNEDYVAVVLKEGKVNFTPEEGVKEIDMLPSERLILRNGKLIKDIVDPSKYNAWTEGKLVFRSDSMAEIARQIERWYNVKVTISDKTLEKYTFRATFQDDKLEDVLKYLAMTSPLSYRIIPRKIVDGTYKKQEIIIYSNK
jgi:ferric-dicitrate binding protein FerR (iron transport regulator)